MSSVERMLRRWVDRCGRRALRCACAVLASLLAIAACGDDAPPPVTGDAGLDPGAKCTPRLAAGWAPRWTPPRAPKPGACTEEQIQLEYAACEGPMATSAACAPWRDDPANAACLACLFSNEADPAYGAIIRLGVSWKTNTAGCIALVDGDTSMSGCAARVQAASACYDAACEGCEPFDSYVQCREQAPSTACRAYYLDGVCLLRPVYSSCTAYVTNRDYFLGAARLFCGASAAARGDVRTADDPRTPSESRAREGNR
jgi:hypothetical protein